MCVYVYAPHFPSSSRFDFLFVEQTLLATFSIQAGEYFRLKGRYVCVLRRYQINKKITSFFRPEMGPIITQTG